MDDATGRAMYKAAGELGMPVGFMLFKGLHLHLSEVIVTARVSGAPLLLLPLSVAQGIKELTKTKQNK